MWIILAYIIIISLVCTYVCNAMYHHADDTLLYIIATVVQLGGLKCFWNTCMLKV